MYCLGGVTDSSTMTSSSPSNVSNGNRDCVLSVVRALGVLICEGRIQGSPRGYKEGPHCAAPLQSPSTQHLCKKDDYLCNRYVILVKEIADRTAIGTSLCVEVFMCADCPCGLSMATCNDPVSSIAQWSNTSEMLLEYWCIRVVPSKSSEVMNFQGLYQAVRSRLHFSQVAAWWSRSSGKKPKYVSTRVVSSSSDNLRKFIDPPIEHTFPLASIGDGNSVKVTVWALPRIEDVPKLHCQIHPVSEIINDNTACALLTPTKASSSPSSTITSSSSSSSSSSSTSPTTTATPPSSSSLPLQYPENHTMVLPIIVDDRLQTPCDQPGKHHCRCEEEETSPPSPSIKPNGERKRRRSLPCGPPDATPSTSLHGNTSLASVSELNTNNIIKNYNDDCKYYDDKLNDKKWHDGNNSQQNYINTITNDRYLINNDDNECNDEKRYKPSSEVGLYFESLKLTNDTINKIDKKQSHKIYDNKKNDDNNKTNDTINLRKTNIIVNPFYVTNPGPSNYNYNNINNLTTTPCNVHLNYNKNSMPEEELNTNDKKLVLPSGELSHLMSKLSFPKDTSKNIKDDGGLFDWITKVPSRVLNGNQNTTTAAAAAATITTIIDDNNDKKIAQDDDKLNSKKVNNYIKLNNCNLELSQREFNEVLAVLKTRTPIGKRRTPVKNLRKKEKFDKTIDEQINTKNSTTTKIASTNEMNKPVKISDKKIGFDRKLNKDKLLTDEIINTNEIVVQNKADVLLGAILRTNCDRKGLGDISNGSRTETIVSLNSQQETEEYEKQNDKKINQQQLLSSPFKIKPYEDDKFLPSVINKRLHRIKQLFKKEQEPKVYNERHKILHDSHDNNNIKYKHHNNNNESYNKIKRKIDFADFNICGNKNSYEQLLNDPDNLHNNVQKCEKKNVKSYYFDDNNADLLSDNLNNDLKNQDGCEGRNESDDKFDNEIINDEIVIMGKNQMSQEDVDDEINDRNVPSAIEQEQFRRSLENAASMVFHSRTGLPLTSSPAPLRRGHCCFDYDSSLNTVSSKRSALFELNTPPSPGAVSLEETDREVENVGDGDEPQKRSLSSRARPQSHALLGNFEESALNGRLEPVSTVHGFTAEIGASGSFCPKHRKLPVTVFFYTLGDNDKVSTPYLAHINLEKKGYQVPRSGTIQVTLLNPLGTVVKMFVVLYDLSDMPPRSHTFLRQRTLRDKTLRYLIHLRFMSGKSGRIYLHTDIRIIICRKSDVDTASDFGSEPPKELRSYIHGPTNPKFSPRC